jgi:hypothetical protein
VCSWTTLRQSFMQGPEILCRSLSDVRIPDKYGNEWQYHSQSDSHSKIACWALLFDLLQHCPLLVEHIAANKVGFGINHTMHDFRTRRQKDLDLVLCTPGSVENGGNVTFSSLADRYGVKLLAAERTLLQGLPVLRRVSVGSVHLAMEAKACMTEHIKALPRLYDELNSSHLAIHGSADFAIAAGFALVNMAETFVSPGRNKWSLTQHAAAVTRHKQPLATQRTIDKLHEIPRRTQQGAEGFDALGIVVIDLANDVSPVKLIERAPAPRAGDISHYDQMVRRIASLYATKFGNI